jgi:exosortase
MPPPLHFSALIRNRWVVPLGAAIILLWVLFLIFPFASGDTSVYGPLGWGLWFMWTKSGDDAQDYSYSFILLILLVPLLWDRKRALLATPIEGSNWAFLVILLGLLLFWLGAKSGKQFIGCGGVQIIIGGTILWFWGWRMFRALLFVWIMIIFLWPLPFVDSTIAFPLRMIVSRLSCFALNVLGEDCVQRGTAIFSAPDITSATGAHFKIDIADPCSGIHSLMPLLMFSALYSHFFLSRRWSQWLVFLSTIPLIVLGNIVRILLLVLASLLWGSAFALGTSNDDVSWYHEACGFAVFVVVLGSQCILGFLLTANERRHQGAPKLDLPRRGSPVVRDSGTVPMWRVEVFMGLIAATIALWTFTPPLRLTTEAGVEMTLPSAVTIGEVPTATFTGVPVKVSEVERKLLPTDTEFSRKLYSDSSKHRVFFSIVLSGRQQYNIHPPQVCLAAQGWTITHEEDYPIKLQSGRTLTVRNLSIQTHVPNGTSPPVLIHGYYMYWYVTAGATTSSHATRNWLSSRDRIFFNTDHRWAYMIAMSAVTAPLIPGGLNDDQTKKMLAAFIRDILPSVQKSEELTDNYHAP